MTITNDEKYLNLETSRKKQTILIFKRKIDKCRLNLLDRYLGHLCALNVKI